MNNHKVEIFALLIVLSLWFTACAVPPVDGPPADGPIEITIWHGWGGEYEAEYRAVAAAFNAQNADIQIRLARVDSDQISDSLAVAVPARQGPDIVQWVQDQIGRNALVGNIVPLDPWIDEAYLHAAFEPAAAEAMIWNDQIWGIPEAQEGIALVYNPALLDADDLPDPADFEDLLDKATQFRAANPDKYYLCNQGLGSPDAYHVAPIYFGNGMSRYYGYIDEDGEVYMNTPEGYAAAEWIARFRAVAPPEADHETCQALFTEGRAAIWWTGPWSIADLESAGLTYGEHYALAPMGSPFVGIKLFMLTTNAVERGHAEAALEVMRYFSSFEIQRRLTLANKTIPANTEALNDPEVQALHTVAGFGESLNLGTPMPNHPYIDCQWNPVGDATTAIWNGAQQPREAMDDAQRAIEACIADMR